MLRYTGHPIADVGVATVCALSNKPDPASITSEDLERVADFLECEYFSGKLLSYLTCVFPNSMYVQPAAQAGAKLKAKPATMRRFKTKMLYGFKEPADPGVQGLRCAFSGEPADQLVYRQHVPLLTGEDVMNFFPAGAGGMPISSEFLLAVQAFPLGGRRCVGRVLAVHCPDDPSLTYEFARRFLEDNRRLLLLAQKSGEKYEDAKGPRTLVINALLDVVRRRRDWIDGGERPPSISVYHLTNSGQGPDIDLYELPSEVISFVALALRAGTADVWSAIVARAWEIPNTQRKGGSGRNGPESDASPQVGRSRNFLYDDLFDLPRRAAQFIRTYFLRRAWRFARKNDPRGEYSQTHDLELVSWPLTDLFLKEVMGMERSRIEVIRTVADRIAEHIDSTSDDRLFTRLSLIRRYDGLRARLLRTSRERVAAGKDPLISFEEFILIFENSEDIPRIDWRLARDLLLIRLLDQLKDRFRKEPEVLESIPAEDEDEETETAARETSDAS